MKHEDVLKDATGKDLVYKYIPPTRLDFLQTELYRFTQPNELNDPFESLPRVVMNKYATEDYEEARVKTETDGLSNLPQEELEMVYMNPYPFQRFDEKSFPGLWPVYRPNLREEPFRSIEEFDGFLADKASREFIDEISKTVGIFCLTRDPHSLLIWAHYASGHQGMLIGFERDHTFFHKSGGLYDVEYLEERIPITSKYGLRRFCGVRFQESVPRLYRSFLRKHPAWSYEAELRMILPLDDCDERLKNNPLVHLFRIPANALRVIVLGARISKANAKFIRRLMARDPRWKHVYLFYAVLDEQDMALKYLKD